MLDEELSKILGGGIVEVIDNEETLVVKYIKSDRYYEIDKNGNSSQIEVIKDKYPGDITKGENGETLLGTEESPYEIWCIEDLIEWSKNSSQYVSSYIELCKTLNFKSPLSYADSTRKDYEDINEDGKIETLIQEMQTGIGFHPVEGYRGTFNGKNNEIRNIFINNEVSYTGLIKDAYGATIKNVLISGNISGKDRAGGIIGRAQNKCKLINCYNLCNIESRGHIGGIVGESSSSIFINCCNLGNLYLREEAESYCSIGGIVGASPSSTLINCYNLGNIKNDCSKVYSGTGGIIGSTVNTASTIINCYNKGTVEGKYTQGAIVGGYWYNNWISDVVNSFYLESSCTKPIGTRINTDLGEETISCTEEYMKSEEFLKELNTYVENYNKENAENEDFIEIDKWIQGKNGYPTFNKNEK